MHEKNNHITVSAFETEDHPELPVNPKGKDVEFRIPEDKYWILEDDNSKLLDCTVTWLNMLNKDIQQRILSRINQDSTLELKKEEVDEDQEEEEEEARKEESTKEPVIPPPTKLSVEVQTDPTERSDQHGSSPSGEVPSSAAGSTSVEGAEKEKP